MILLAAIGLSVCLSSAAFYTYLRKAYLLVSIERLQVIASETKKVVESRINLGLPIVALTETQGLVERIKAREKGLSAITVFGEAGVTLFSTDRAGIGEPVPGVWLNEAGKLNDDTWTVVDDDGVEVGAPVINSFNRPVGGITIRVTRGYADVQNAEMLGIVLGVVGLFSLLAVGAAYVGSALVVRSPRGAMLAGADYAAMLHGYDAEDREIDPRAVEAEPSLALYGRRVAGAMSAIRAADDAIQAIDEGS